MHLRTETLSVAACRGGLASIGYLCLSCGHMDGKVVDFCAGLQAPEISAWADKDAGDVPLAVNPVTLSPLRTQVKKLPEIFLAADTLFLLCRTIST